AGGFMHRSAISSARKQFARHNLLIQRAAQHRASPTPAERALWSALRGKQLGAWFRRQLRCPHSLVLARARCAPAVSPKAVLGAQHLRAAGGDASGKARGSLILSNKLQYTRSRPFTRETGTTAHDKAISDRPTGSGARGIRSGVFIFVRGRTG